MKISNIFSTLGSVLMLAGIMTACTDEVSYNPSQKETGAQVFFSSTLSSVVDIPQNATSITIPVERYSDSEDVTVQLSSEIKDEEGGNVNFITVPSSVSFTKGEKSANINIGVDFSKVVPEENYTIVLKIEEEYSTNYGNNEITLIASYAPWSEWARYGGAGEYGAGTLPVFSYATEDLPVWFRKSTAGVARTMYQFGDYACPELQPDEKLQIDFINGVNVTIIVDEEAQVGSTNYKRCSVPEFIVPNGNTGTVVKFTDVYTYLTEINKNVTDDQEIINSWKNGCLYDPETGRFEFTLMAYGSALGGDDKFQMMDNMFQLPGFASYYINFNKVYNIVDNKGNESVVISALKSEDIASYAYNIIPGKLSETAINQAQDVLAANVDATLIRDAEYYITYTPESAGDYTLVAVAYNEDNNEVYRTSYTFTYQSVQNSEWESIGQATYTDGFLYPLYGGQIGGETWTVNVQKSTKTDGLYRVVNPYNSEFWPSGNPNWDMDGAYYMVIHAEDPDGVYIEPFELGITLSPDDGAVYGNSLGYFFMEGGNSFEDVKNAGFMGYMENNVIYFPGMSLLTGFANDVDSNGNLRWIYSNWDMNIDPYIYGPDGKPVEYNVDAQLGGLGYFELDLNDTSVAKAPRVNTNRGAIEAHPKAIRGIETTLKGTAIKSVNNMTQKEIRNHLIQNNRLFSVK